MMKPTCIALLILFLTSSDVQSTEQSPETWIGFRGDGTNITRAKNVPVNWSPEKGIAWSVDIPGYGQSSPVIWHDNVYLTSIDGQRKEKCLVHAYSLKNGNRLWVKEFAATQKQKNTSMTSRAAPTAVVDERNVYTFFESGELICLNHAGKVLWKRSLASEYGETSSMHGLGASLAQTDHAVIVLVADAELSYLMAVEKNTGKNLWKIDREKKTSWTSPVVAYRNGNPEIIVSSNGAVEGYNGSTGKFLWELDGLSGNTIPSVSITGNYILVGASESRRNPNPKQASKSNCCLRLVEKEGKPSYHVIWSAEKAISYYSTPLAYLGKVYYVNKVGVLYCLDLKTGKELFSKRIEGPCWASPLGANGHVYFFTRKGLTVVIKATQKFQKVATNSLPVTNNGTEALQAGRGGMMGALSGTILYGVAAVEGNFVIRTGKKIYCIKTKQ